MEKPLISLVFLKTLRKANDTCGTNFTFNICNIRNICKLYSVKSVNLSPIMVGRMRKGAFFARIICEPGPS